MNVSQENPVIITDDKIKETLEALLRRHKNDETAFKVNCRAQLGSLPIEDIRVSWQAGLGLVDLYIAGRSSPICVTTNF
jgi:tRNA(Ser,Leu) C12 N-acetylase TAN1